MREDELKKCRKAYNLLMDYIENLEDVYEIEMDVDVIYMESEGYKFNEYEIAE